MIVFNLIAVVLSPCLGRKYWFVYAKRPFAEPEQALTLHLLR
jgi:hypothetical protein